MQTLQVDCEIFLFITLDFQITLLAQDSFFNKGKRIITLGLIITK